jgi:hypothetical protein
MGGTTVEAPPPRDYGQETRDTLEAQVQLAPQLFASEAEFRPQYAQLERGIMLENLGLDPRLGLLDAFRQISGAQKDIQYDSTQADIDMIRDLGPELAEAQRAADPEADALRQAIMADAIEGMEAEGGLTEEEMRLVDQRILEGAADRGMSDQKSTLLAQMRGQLEGDRAIKQQRLQNAGVAYGMGNFDPLLALTGRTGNSPVMAQQGFQGAGFTLDSSPAIFNPESSYAGSLAASNQQNIMDARTATAANRASMFGGLMGGLGSLGGGLLTGSMGKGGFFNK